MKKLTYIFIALVLSFCVKCKHDYYIVTPEGWHIHSSVPIDSTLR